MVPVLWIDLESALCYPVEAFLPHQNRHPCETVEVLEAVREDLDQK